MKNPAFSNRDVVVMGASAGGVEVLKHIIRELPANFQAAVFVCLHIPAQSVSVLPTILARNANLKVHHAQDGEAIESGCVYVAPPDMHMVIEGHHVHLTRGPRENGHRPSIDPLFRSAAKAFGPRVIGVILSGSLDDGTAGMSVIQSLHGVTVVQDPLEAIFRGMPNSVIENITVDYICPVAEIAPLLERLVSEALSKDQVNMEPNADQSSALDIAEHLIDLEDDPTQDRPPSIYTCPECHGSLWELEEGSVVKYRCRTGHAFSSDSLYSEQTQFLETALWTALRALKEKEDLARRLADRASARGYDTAANLFREQIADVIMHANIIREVLKATKKSVAEESAA